VTLAIALPPTAIAQRRPVNVNLFDNNIHHDGFLKMYKPSLSSRQFDNNISLKNT